jgi:hypothetical protein
MGASAKANAPLEWSKPFHLEIQAILIRSSKHDPVAVPFQIPFADDYVSVGVLLCGVHGRSFQFLLSVPSWQP